MKESSGHRGQSPYLGASINSGIASSVMAATPQLANFPKRPKLAISDSFQLKKLFKFNKQNPSTKYPI